MEGFHPVEIHKSGSSVRAFVNGTEIKSGQNWDIAISDQEAKIGFHSAINSNPFGPEMRSMCVGTLEYMGEEVKIAEGMLLRPSAPSEPIKVHG